MAKWVDKTMEKPKEPYKQKLSFVNRYNDYGFDYNNGMYSLPEENRDFRKHIENEIKMEEMKTQNILGQHITDEIDRNIENTDQRAEEINENIDNTRTELKQEINSAKNYVINTLSTEIEAVDDKVDTAITKIDENKSVIDRIWAKVETLRNAVIG